MRTLTLLVDQKYNERDPLVGSSVNAINAKCIAYEEMQARWELPDDLLGGTLTMRKKATTWLPQEEKESEGAYACRVARSILYEAYRINLERLSNKPFSRSLVVKGTLSSEMAQVVKNADKSGLSLSALAEEMLFCGMHYGLTHLVVDYPAMPPGATKADEERIGARPTLVHTPACRVFSWTPITNPDGTDSLESVRILEQKTEQTGYSQIRVNYIREYTATTWALYREVETKEPGKGTTYTWVKDKDGIHTFGRVPLFTMYVRRTGFMAGTPAFESIAWLNLAHFQSMSDQRNLLRFTRLGLLFGAGFTAEEIANGIVISPSAFVSSTNPEATLKYVETSGQAMTLGREDLEDIERRMEGAGLEALQMSMGGESSTGRAIDEQKSRSFLHIWVSSLSEVIHQAFTSAAEWIKKPVTDLTVDIYSDFTLSPRSRDDMLGLLEARTKGEISRKRFWKEWQRRGMFEDLVDIPQEVKEAIDDLMEDMKRRVEVAPVLASSKPGAANDTPTGGSGGKGSSRLGGTGGSGVRDNINDTNGGKSSRRGENQGKRGNSIASGTTGA